MSVFLDKINELNIHDEAKKYAKRKHDELLSSQNFHCVALAHGVLVGFISALVHNQVIDYELFYNLHNFLDDDFDLVLKLVKLAEKNVT